MASGAQTTYKKQPGTLVLAATALEWTAQGQPTPSLSLPTSNLSALFASKPGGPRVMLKVVLQLAPAPPSEAGVGLGVGTGGAGEDSHNFTFVSPTNPLGDRDWFKDQLSQHIARNRERDAQQASVQAAGIQGAASGDSTAAGASSTRDKGKGREADASRSGTPAAAGGTPTPGAAGTAAPAQATTFRLRKLVLQADPTLLQLHRDLVLTGDITETEFWAGRQDLIDAIAAEQGLVKGKSGEMVDPKTVTGQNGEVTVKITPALIRDIFEEFPVVLRAYNDNVPDPLDEAQFWTRYFQSKLFNRNRTTNRAAVDAIKDDPIFDKYLGEEDDDIEPKHMPDHEIYRLLDLAATEEDQHEITNQPRDFTMKPGGQRASLPLMRRFNEHSERLLNQTLGSSADRSRGFLDPGNAGDRRYYNEIELSDLVRPGANEDRIALTLSDRSASANAKGDGDGADAEDGAGDDAESLQKQFEKARRVKSVISGVSDEWEGKLAEFEVDSSAVRDSMRDMTNSLVEHVERTRKTAGGSASSTGGLPRQYHTTVSSLSTTTFEFLRHFWSALLPPKPNDTSAFALAPPKERAQRVEKFRGYLDKSRERVDRAMEDAAKESGEVGKRVEAALRPVREAIDAALGTYAQRMGTSGSAQRTKAAPPRAKA
ncbi:hypothetical protein BMF94_5964 [Rhodotorula taiwanensis]|uniref:BSD domain-containing protein n=1 Tax=Rhodotorula taiwanensis TaxID=741276 RepID=A0A2S5B2M6_9BASI|nr:hypothetical protein BMF94_5964 [Rhodotorula taiwanensis]